jgi:transposase
MQTAGICSLRTVDLLSTRAEHHSFDRNVTHWGWKPGKKIMYGNPYYNMMERYKNNPDEWIKQYHQRSVIEAVFSGLK